MFKGLLKNLSKNPMFIYLAILTLASTAGLQGWRTLLNNFAVEVGHLGGVDIGIIQSVREIPGFLALFAIFFIRFIPEHRFAAVTIILLGASIAITGFFPSVYGLAITTLLMSTGFHYYETTNQSLTLQYFDQQKAPMVLSYQRSFAALISIAVGLLIWYFSKHLALSFVTLFSMIGFAVLLIGIWALFQNPEDKDIIPQKKKFLLRKKYWLYYVLTFLAGARRQIFVAFAVFLLVQRFHFDLAEISILFVANNVINFFLYPYLGRFVVRFGEQKLLSIEYFSLIFIFFGYAYTDSSAVVIALYFLDQILFNFSFAIRTFFQKIGDPTHIAPSMSMGFTINHIAAVIIPFAGGLMWDVNYKLPFIFGAIIAILSLVFVQFINPTLKANYEESLSAQRIAAEGRS